MNALSQLIEKVQKTKSGFKDIEQEAHKLASECRIDESWKCAKQLYNSNIEEVRMCAVFVMGFIASEHDDGLAFLREKISNDESWRVQEVLAKAFDHYCSKVGYENALPTIRSWLSDQRANVRRAVTEGLRIWTNRDFFKEHPSIAVELLSELRMDNSEYVRKSVGNALRDISKKHGELVQKELKGWLLATKEEKQTYRLANKLF